MTPGDRPLLGILYANVALIIYALDDALIRFLSSDFSPVQIDFSQSFVVTIMVGAVILGLRRPHRFISRRPRILIIIGLLSAVTSVAFYFALANLDLADAYTLGMGGPFFVAMFSGWFLKEPVSLQRWLAIALGFGAILIVMQPGAGVFNIWAVLAVLSALTYAIEMMFYRVASRTEDSLTLIFYVSLCVTVVLAPVTAFVWTDMLLWEIPLLAATGVMAGAGQYFIVLAYRYAAANTVITFDYMSVIYIGIIGYLLFSEVPTWNLLIGVVLLIASGLYIVFDETRQHKRLAQAVGG